MVEIGKKYNRLLCLGRDNSKDSRYWLFKCDCGNTASIIGKNVERGATSSCGCHRNYILKSGKTHTTYGYSHTRIDNIYKNMISRCYKPNNNRYKNYGARGITVCEEWKNDKTKFFEWAFANGYSKELTIDRIDVNSGYSPENCKWSTYKEQANNKSNSRYLEYQGVKHTLSEWADIKGLKSGVIYARLKRGDSIERALRTN